MAVTVLLGFLFVQEIVAELMPKSESIPFLAVYVVFSLVLATCNVAACTLIVAISNISPTIPPPLILRILVVRVFGYLIFGSYFILWQLFCWLLHVCSQFPLSIHRAFSSLIRRCCSCWKKAPPQLIPSADSTSTATALKSVKSTCNNDKNNVEVPLLVPETLPVPSQKSSLVPTASSVTISESSNATSVRRGNCTRPESRIPPQPPPRSSSYPPRSPPAAPFPVSFSEAPPSPNPQSPLPLSLFHVVGSSISRTWAEGLDDTKIVRKRLEAKKTGRNVKGMSPKLSYAKAPFDEHVDKKFLEQLRKKKQHKNARQQEERHTRGEGKQSFSHMIGLGAENWQDVARVMNMANSLLYIGASAYIFYEYFIPIFPFSKFNHDINGECPESGVERKHSF